MEGFQTRFVRWLFGEYIDSIRVVYEGEPQPAVVCAMAHEAEPTRYDDPMCGSCEFWVQEKKLTGFCRALPPMIADHSLANRPRGLWPTTAAADWCGAYEPRN